MPRPVIVALMLFVSGTLLSTHATLASTKKSAARTDPAVTAVDQVLRAEVTREIDRRGQLAATLEQHPDSAAARWQSGFVRDGDEWIRFEDVASAKLSNQSLSAYLERRGRASQTAKAQLDLANWCKANKLPDQERSHLRAAVALDPGIGSEQIARRLGYEQVCGQWLSGEELLEWHEMNRQSLLSLAKWESQLTKLADRLSGTRGQRESAIDSLKKMADQATIPAIEYVLAGKDQETALVAIELLQRLDVYAAAQALARQSVISPWPEIRKSAAAALKGRPLDHFVPDLLGLLSGPVTTQLQMWQDLRVAVDRPSCTLYYNFILTRETENQFQVAALRTVDHTLESKVIVTIGLRTGNTTASLDREATSPRFNIDWRRSIADRMKQADDAVIRENERISEFNGRVGLVLAVVSGKDPQATPQEWWQWWSVHSDLDSSVPKSVVTVGEYESDVGYPSLPQIRYSPSCFAAGTPVWTELGPRPIESIQIGDQVLAKNAKTGELKYKPVLKTTVRPPKELTMLRIGNETIACTGGHRFWVSGSGWIKARDLEPQSLLHTVTGSTPVGAAKKGQTAETYNLVVADFHTYFVGKAGILCQDLGLPRPSNSIVPGLSGRAAAPTKN